MEQTWRWFGPDDPVSLDDVRQAGATGIISALHEYEPGEVWPVDAINERRAMIENTSNGRTPLRWSVVESVPVHDDIKSRQGLVDEYMENYKQTLRNLGECGIDAVCYNFMPLIDWTRTDLAFTLPSGAKALRFDADRFAAFDLFILEREHASEDYDDEALARAKKIFKSMDGAERDNLTTNIIAGLPGRMTDAYGLEDFRDALARYRKTDDDTYRQNLFAFLDEIIPVAEECGIRMAIHPDDPPRKLLGLPRVVSTAADVRGLLAHNKSSSNGITLCAGTFGVRPDNDLVAMAREFGPRIFFAHLRGTKREENPLSFYEAEHLGSDIDMIGILKELKNEEVRRGDGEIPIRPDHGHQMLDDLSKNANPGYSAIGRLKGLAEIRGVIAALEYEG